MLNKNEMILDGQIFNHLEEKLAKTPITNSNIPTPQPQQIIDSSQHQEP